MSNVYDLSARLRVFAKLDPSKLSAEFMQKVEHEEGSYEYVDLAISRDLPWTEEITAARIGAILVDEDGSVLAEYPGEDGWLQAEKARSSAKMTFSIDVEQGGAIEPEEDLSEPADAFPEFAQTEEAAKAAAKSAFLAK